MDWTTILKSQQADFIKRLNIEPPQLLETKTRGCHTELVTISGQTLKEIRSQCKKSAVYVEQLGLVRDNIRTYLKQFIAQEALAIYLDSLVTKIDPYEAKELQKNIHFLVKDNPDLGIYVVTNNTDEPAPQWQINPLQLQPKTIIVCILFQETINEKSTTSKPILAGFLPLDFLPPTQQKVSLKLSDLLYISGLKTYLDSQTSQNTKLLQMLTGISTYPYPLAISGDGKTIACSNYDGSIKLWHVTAPEMIAALAGESRSYYPRPNPSTGSPAPTETTLNRLDSTTATLQSTLVGHTSGVSSIALSSDSQTLVSGGYDGSIKTWDIHTGQIIHSIYVHTGMVKPLVISQDSQLIASASPDKTLKICSIQTGSIVQTFSLDTDTIVSIALCESQQWVLAGTLAGILLIWELKTGHLLSTLVAHSSSITSIALTADGQTLATTSIEKTIKLWNPITGGLRTTLTDHSDSIINLIPHNSNQMEINLQTSTHGR